MDLVLFIFWQRSSEVTGSQSYYVVLSVVGGHDVGGVLWFCTSTRKLAADVGRARTRFQLVCSLAGDESVVCGRIIKETPTSTSSSRLLTHCRPAPSIGGVAFGLSRVPSPKKIRHVSRWLNYCEKSSVADGGRLENGVLGCPHFCR